MIERYNPYLEEEKPLVELPTILISFIVFISILLALSLLFFPPLYVFVVFLALSIGLAIVLNPFVAIPIFIIGGYLHPVAFVPALARYHPTTIFAAGVLLAMTFHIIIYRDFKVIKSKQLMYMFFFSLVILISSVFHWEYSSYAFIDFLKILILYFVVVYLVDTRFRISILIFLLIPLGIIVASYAFYLQAQGIGRGFIEGAMRVVSFEDNPNYLALSLAMLIPLLFGLLMCVKSNLVKIILIFIIFFFSIVTTMTYSRSGFLGLSVALIFSVKKFFSGKNVVLLFIILSLLSLIFIIFAPPQFYERIESVTNLQEASIVGRLDVYRVASIIMLQNPFIGIGLGSYNFTLEYFNIAITMPNITNKVMTWTHNVFLEIGAKAGIIALIFFILVLFYALRDLKESQRIFDKKGDSFLSAISRSIEVSIISYLIFAMFATSLTLKIFWVLLAMTVALRQIAHTYESEVSEKVS